MHEIHIGNKTVPKAFENEFTKLTSTHEHNTRQSTKFGYFPPRVKNRLRLTYFQLEDLNFLMNLITN